MTLKTLTDAIRSRVDEGMEENVAESIAEHALGFFGFSNRIIDNALEPTDRNLFYQLQDYELLNFNAISLNTMQSFPIQMVKTNRRSGPRLK